MYHANFWSAAGDSVIGPGSIGEYGNIFDLMGADSSTPGIHEFGAGNKHALDWLPLSFVHTVTSSGTYRVFAFDVPNLVGGQQYALRVQKDYARWYWAEYRQKFTGNPWTQNGLILNWSPWNNPVGNSLRGTAMLDTTPGTPAGNNGRDDAPVVIGRTFSALAAGIHLTPLAKGTGSSGNWLDLRVNLGSFPGNLAPVLQLAADQTSVPADTLVNFSATASDADGDTLAYDWDFGDLTFGTNSPFSTKSWSGSGEYVARCTVSDMKGGVASRSVVVTVGTPGTFQVGGRVTTVGGQAVEGVRVHNGLGDTAYRGACSDSDGYYVVANLAAGSHTLSAVKYGYALATAGWSNPVAVGPGLADQDWTATQGPVLSIAASDPVATEAGADPGRFTLSRAGSLASPLNVRFSLSGTATYSSDYALAPVPAAGPPLQLVMPAGGASIDIGLTALDDPAAEGPETVTLTLFENSAYVLGSFAEATVTIADSQAPGTPTVTIVDNDPPTIMIAATDDTAVEGSSNTGTLTVARVGSLAADLVVRYVLTGTAANGVDYVALPGTVTIPAGQVSASFMVSPLNDSLVEGTETVIATILRDPTYNIGNPGSASVVITDDDSPRITLAASDASASEAGANPGTFTVTRTGSSAEPLTVFFSVSGSAINGADYLQLSNRIVIPAGSAGAPLTVTPVDDTIRENNETVVMTLVPSPTDCYSLNTTTAKTVTILDNDSGGLVGVAFTHATSSGPEDEFLISVTVSLSAASPVPVTVNYAFGGGTATRPADYNFDPPQPIYFSPGTVTQSIFVLVNDHTLVEPGETLVIALSNPVSAALDAFTTHTHTILDNDNLAGTLAVAPATGLHSVGPGGGPFTPATATYTLSNIAGTPLDWEASADVPWLDLSASSGTLASGASVEVLVTLNDQAETLLPQTYSATVAFTNTTNPQCQYQLGGEPDCAPPASGAQPDQPDQRRRCRPAVLGDPRQHLSD